MDGPSRDMQDWSAISDVVELPVRHSTDDRTWTLREFCKTIFASDVSLPVTDILLRAAPFKAFGDPAAYKFEHGLHRELTSQAHPSLDYVTFAALVDNVLDVVAEELTASAGVTPGTDGLYTDAEHDEALEDSNR